MARMHLTLFFNCVKILPLWWESMSWLNVVGVFPNTSRDLFLQHSYCNLECIKIQRWKIWWISLTWCIWHPRNRIIFSNDSLNAYKLMKDALFLYWTWLTNLEKRISYSIPLMIQQYQGKVLCLEGD